MRHAGPVQDRCPAARLARPHAGRRGRVPGRSGYRPEQRPLPRRPVHVGPPARRSRTPGGATTAQWAHLHGRCLVRSARRQTYGTQYRLYCGHLEMCPVADPADLDQRRASVGLSPHHDRLALLNRRHITVQELTVVTQERAAA
ncbi:DUF6624 domain-containing protein [Streptomyces alfalfae]